MSLKFGLNIKSKAKVPVRRAAFDDDDDGADSGHDAATGPVETAIEEISFVGGSSGSSKAQPRAPPAHSAHANQRHGAKPPPPLESRENRSAVRAADRSVKAAQELDPSIFDYDSFFDAKASVSEEKKAAARQEAIERKPKYINNLLDAAARRKQDQLVAREKLLQREREAEGDEFADKEKFVTEAYKQQQEETRKIEEEERKRAEIDASRKDKLGGGMQTFYRNLMDQNEEKHQEAMQAAKKSDHASDPKPSTETREQTDAELVAQARAKGVKVHTNEEGQITDKRELLSAGLNVGTTGRSADEKNADHLRSSNIGKSAFPSRSHAGQQAQRERQSRMVEEQLEAQAKRAREEEEEEQSRLEKAAKSSKTEKDVSDAKARYLARKAAKARGEA